MWPFYIEKHRQEACIEEINAAVTASGFELNRKYFPTKAGKSAIVDSFYRYVGIIPNHGKQNTAFSTLMQLKKKGVDYTIDVLVKDGNEIIHPPHLRQECISECDNDYIIGLSHNCNYKLKCMEWLDEVQHYAKDFLAKEEKESRILSEIYKLIEEEINEEIRKNKRTKEEINEFKKNYWEYVESSRLEFLVFSRKFYNTKKLSKWEFSSGCGKYLKQYKLWKDCEPMECPNCYQGMTTRKYLYEMQGENNGQPRDFEECGWCGGTGILSDRTQIDSYNLRELEKIAKKLTEAISKKISITPRNFGVYVRFNTKD